MFLKEKHLAIFFKSHTFQIQFKGIQYFPTLDKASLSAL